jgi:hypothetical protein
MEEVIRRVLIFNGKLLKRKIYECRNRYPHLQKITEIVFWHEIVKMVFSREEGFLRRKCHSKYTTTSLNLLGSLFGKVEIAKLNY